MSTASWSTRRELAGIDRELDRAVRPWDSLQGQFGYLAMDLDVQGAASGQRLPARGIASLNACSHQRLGYASASDQTHGLPALAALPNLSRICAAVVDILDLLNGPLNVGCAPGPPRRPRPRVFLLSAFCNLLLHGEP